MSQTDNPYANAHAKVSASTAPEQETNPYSARFRATVEPDLDTNIPKLISADVKRLNRRVLLVFGVTALLLATIAFLAIRAVENRKPAAAKPREETLTVPEAPKTAPVHTNNSTPANSTAPIALAPSSGAHIINSQSLFAPPLPPPSSKPAGPSLVERRMMGGSSESSSEASTASANAQASADTTRAQQLYRPDTLMLRGTYIRCVLETRIVTDIPGFTSCVVTEPVYSVTGGQLLLPKGSKVFGKYDTVPDSARVAVIWDRIVTPTHIDITMSSPGVDNLGGAGHPGHYNAHWISRIGSALLISLLSDAFKYEGAKRGPTQTTISNGVVTQTPFESNTAQTLQDIAQQAVQRSANRPPTVTINQGSVINIYVAKDVDFSGVIARF